MCEKGSVLQINVIFLVFGVFGLMIFWGIYGCILRVIDGCVSFVYWEVKIIFF